MSQRQKKASLAGVLVVLIAGMLVLAITISHPGGATTASAQQAPPPAPIDGHDIARLLQRVGCSADGLAAVGFNTANLGLLFGTLAGALETARADIETADSQLIVARQTEAQLFRQIQRGEGSDDDIQALADIRALIPTLESQQADHLAGAFDAVKSLFTFDQQRLLQRIAANTNRGLPAEYLVVDRTDQQWAYLRDALDMERVYPEWGEELPLELRVELSNVRNEADVQTARAGTTALRDQMASAYESAIDDWMAP